MENCLTSFVCNAPVDLIDIICNYLDFSDFLSLSSISKTVRIVLVNHHRCWLNFYMRSLVYRRYNHVLDGKDTSNKYRFNIPSLESNLSISYPVNNLLNSARRVEIMTKENVYSSNPMLNLGILDNFKRERWKGEYKEYRENLNSLPSAVVPNDGNKPFLVISNTNVCGFNVDEDRFITNNLIPPWKRNYGINVKLCCWLSFEDYKYNKQLNMVNAYETKVLVIAYNDGSNSLVLSFYYYDNVRGFAAVPGMTIKMNLNQGDVVTCIDAYGLISKWDGRMLLFKILNVLIGTESGHVYQYVMEYNNVLVNKREYIGDLSITSLKYIPCYSMSILIVYTTGKFVGIYNVTSNDWESLISIHDEITSYSIDSANSIFGYTCKSQNRGIFIDLYKALDFHYYNIPKPPLCLISLKRNSKWALVVRNYIRILQVLYPCDEAGNCNIVFKSLNTLNGHTQSITQCSFDGWSKLVTMDSCHQLFVWDYVNGCKIFSFPLLATHQRSVYKKNNKCSLRNTYQSFSEDEFYDSDKTPVAKKYNCSLKSFKKHNVHANNMRGLLVKGDKLHVDISVQSLVIYYQSCNMLQAWSFK